MLIANLCELGCDLSFVKMTRLREKLCDSASLRAIHKAIKKTALNPRKSV